MGKIDRYPDKTYPAYETHKNADNSAEYYWEEMQNFLPCILGVIKENPFWNVKFWVKKHEPIMDLWIFTMMHDSLENDKFYFYSQKKLTLKIIHERFQFLCEFERFFPLTMRNVKKFLFQKVYFDVTISS